jgi:peptide/nickel transport system permease protein
MSSLPVAPEEAPAQGPSVFRTARRHPVLRFLRSRIAAGVVTLFAASILVFLATEVLPGNPATMVLGRDATPAAVHELTIRLGLNHPLVSQYLHWLWGALRGNLGNSASQIAQGATSAPISSMIGGPLENSAILAGLTIVFMVPISVVLGVFSGLMARRTVDHVISVGSIAFGGVPEFVTGSLLLLIFFTVLHALPPVAIVPPGESPLANPRALVLPVLTLLVVTCGWAIRQIRSGVVETMGERFVTMARLNGYPEHRVIWRYIVRNSLAVGVQVIALNIQYLFGGIIIVEWLFSYPGLGQLLIQAVNARDFQEVQAVAMIIAAFYILVNVLADLLVVFLVPKLRTNPA